MKELTDVFVSEVALVLNVFKKFLYIYIFLNVLIC